MKLSSPRLWITICSLLAVSMFAIVDLRRTSPGPVSTVHAQLEELDGGESCAQCHGGWFSNMTDSCLECHAVIREQMEAKKGIHGTVANETAQHCASCHGEHHGASFALVNDSSFRGTGAKSTAEFDHRFVGFDMNGRHSEIGCVECHEHSDDSVLLEGTTRYLGLAQDCASCHEDPHEGRMQVACAACHGQTKWDELHSEGHEKNLPLVGGHGALNCRECHATTSAHSLESMGSTKARPEARDCMACHASPHTNAFANGAAQIASKPVGGSCVSCHAADHTSFRQPGLTITAEQHAQSGFPLTMPHDKALCADCHDPAGLAFAARYAGRSPDACSTCHADPHGGQFAHGPFANQECTTCHDRAHFVPNAFTAEKHALAALPLDGTHATIDCNECHTRPTPETPRTFHGTASQCVECHQDAHGGFFDGVLAPEELPKNGACAECHNTTKFAQIPPPGFDHERFTDFAIQGAHAQSECSSCHPSAAAADESGRTFGRVETHFGTFTGCVTCHKDPHQGSFDTSALPAEVDGRTDCARCHDESSFRSFSHGFDHGRWTGFQLAGAHEEATCSACHEPIRPADAIGRTWQKALGSACSDCHVDPHAGQFEGRGSARCAQCHTDSTKSFLSFNHDRDARFPLREQHEGLECAACHKSETAQDGREFVRYRPLGTECVDCHGVHEDVLMHRKRRRNG